MLPKGKFPWYSPQQILSEEASTIFNQLSSIKDLPHIPSAIMKLQTMLQNPEAEVDEIVSTIKLDPILASQILVIANNMKAFRNPDGSKISSLEHAVMYIGKRTLNDMIMAIPIKMLEVSSKLFDTEKFWTHSFIQAAIAEKIALRFSSMVNPEEAYLAAFLSNLGKVIAAIYFPEKTDEIYSYVTDPKTMTNWKTAEETLQATSHSILGEIGAALWGLPDFVMDAARFHHSLPKLQSFSKDETTIVDIVSFSNMLAHWMMFEPARIDKELMNIYQKNFQLSDKQVEKLVEELSFIKQRTSLVAA